MFIEEGGENWQGILEPSWMVSTKGKITESGEILQPLKALWGVEKAWMDFGKWKPIKRVEKVTQICLDAMMSHGRITRKQRRKLGVE